MEQMSEKSIVVFLFYYFSCVILLCFFHCERDMNTDRAESQLRLTVDMMALSSPGLVTMFQKLFSSILNILKRFVQSKHIALFITMSHTLS